MTIHEQYVCNACGRQANKQEAIEWWGVVLNLDSDKCNEDSIKAFTAIMSGNSGLCVVDRVYHFCPDCSKQRILLDIKLYGVGKGLTINRLERQVE